MNKLLFSILLLTLVGCSHQPILNPIATNPIKEQLPTTQPEEQPETKPAISGIFSVIVDGVLLSPQGVDTDIVIATIGQVPIGNHVIQVIYSSKSSDVPIVSRPVIIGVLKEDTKVILKINIDPKEIHIEAVTITKFNEGDVPAIKVQKDNRLDA